MPVPAIVATVFVLRELYPATAVEMTAGAHTIWVTTTIEGAITYVTWLCDQDPHVPGNMLEMASGLPAQDYLDAAEVDAIVQIPLMLAIV